MSSAVGVDDECIAAYKAIQSKSSSLTNLQSVTFKIQDEKIVVDSPLAPYTQFDEWVGRLPQDEPRYILVDHVYESADGRPMKKLLFVFYCSDDIGVKQKMLYASSKDNLKRKLGGVTALEISELSELTKEEFTNKLR